MSWWHIRHILYYKYIVVYIANLVSSNLFSYIYIDGSEVEKKTILVHLVKHMKNKKFMGWIRNQRHWHSKRLYEQSY